MNVLKRDHMAKRLVMCVTGVLLTGVAVGFFKLSVFGVDPFQTLMNGIDAVVPIPFGTLYVIVNVCLLLFSLVFDRHYIGLATFVNLFFLGYVIDFSTDLMLGLFPDIGIPGRIFVFIIAITFSCFAVSLYFTADLGVSTYDAVALILSGTLKKGRFKYIRIATDLCCVVTGVGLYLLSGNPPSGLPSIVGIGTVATALFMGPLIDFFNRRVSQPFLSR